MGSLKLKNTMGERKKRRRVAKLQRKWPERSVQNQKNQAQKIFKNPNASANKTSKSQTQQEKKSDIYSLLFFFLSSLPLLLFFFLVFSSPFHFLLLI
jgi:ABC-type Na+ efflux pump permease subunit